MITMANYQEIELLLSRLLEEVSLSFSTEEAKEVSGFIDVGEYGLALRTFVDVVVEESRRISPNAFRIVEKLTLIMDIFGEFDWEVVLKFVDL